MSNRKILYGYQIRDGEIAAVNEEAIHVRRGYSHSFTSEVFPLYQKISNLLQRREDPV